VLVDHAPDRGREPARAEVVQTPLPRFERLAPRAELQDHELLLTVGEDRDDAGGRDAHNLPGAPDLQGQGVEVEAKRKHLVCVDLDW
jgi:hypothetical protein